MIFNNIEFNMDWRQGTSPRETLPRGYALTTRRSKRSDAISHKISGGGPQLTGMRNM
jgi:hypothetical protein